MIRASIQDPEQFREIFERHYESVFRFVARHVGRWCAADLTSDVFERALRIRGRYDLTLINARPWLIGIAYNVVGDDIRRRRVQNAKGPLAAVRSTTVDEDPIEALLSDLTAESVGAEVIEMLDRLPPRQRKAFVLYAVDELTYEEIAILTRTRLGTVKSRIHRARVKLNEDVSPAVAAYLRELRAEVEE